MHSTTITLPVGTRRAFYTAHDAKLQQSVSYKFVFFLVPGSYFNIINEIMHVIIERVPIHFLCVLEILKLIKHSFCEIRKLKKKSEQKKVRAQKIKKKNNTKK